MLDAESFETSQTVAVACDRLPIGAPEKEEVEGTYTLADATPRRKQAAQPQKREAKPRATKRQTAKPSA